MESVKILVHDYAGHPFQVQLSRELAERGHSVTHCYDANFVTPHGDLSLRPNDANGFSIAPLSAGGALDKHALIRRWSQERKYGKILAEFVREQSPEVVLSANTPLGAQALALTAAREVGARFVFWLQDLYGIGIDRALRARLPVAGSVIGKRFIRTERRLLAASDAVVAISADFASFVLESGVPERNLHVIENWGPLADFDATEPEVPWKERHGLAGKFLFLYSGTLGLKHNPELLASVARAFASCPDVAVVVASEGVGVEWLRECKATEGLTNLHLLGFQPYADLPAMLRSADVLMAILEPEASVFSVPSKVLTSMCAGRPILAAIPAKNLAARVIARSNAGVVVDPSSPGALAEAAAMLWENAELRRSQGKAGRAHAEQHFRIESIADRFEEAMNVSTVSQRKQGKEVS